MASKREHEDDGDDIGPPLPVPGQDGNEDDAGQEFSARALNVPPTISDVAWRLRLMFAFSHEHL